MNGVTFHDLTVAQEIPAALLRRTVADLTPYCERARPIVESVRVDGDAALQRCARQFDGVTAASMSLRATPEEFADAARQVPAEVIAAIRHASDNIRRFHEAQKPGEMWLKEMQPGVFAGDRHVPIDSVACYVPRGKGSFPSVLNMTVVPAMVAGVPRIIVLTPPGPDGRVDAGTLVAAAYAGVTEVYKAGGAHAVAAAAYGTATVPACVKIVGPGSPWVLAAKRLLADVIDPGVPAGPSESIVLADDSADGRLAALDLLIEAEHGTDSCAYLVTDSRRVAEAALQALPALWQDMDPQRADFSRTVLGGRSGGVVLTGSFDKAVEFVNAYAPEHLEILAAEPLAVLGRIRNAGEVLLGPHTPITLGNYVLGMNAVLPTGRKALTHSPLSVHDFMKRISVGWVTRDGYDGVAVSAGTLARYEGFDAHARAVSPLRRTLLLGG